MVLCVCNLANWQMVKFNKSLAYFVNLVCNSICGIMFFEKRVCKFRFLCTLSKYWPLIPLFIFFTYEPIDWSQLIIFYLAAVMRLLCLIPSECSPVLPGSLSQQQSPSVLYTCAKAPPSGEVWQLQQTMSIRTQWREILIRFVWKSCLAASEIKKNNNNNKNKTESLSCCFSLNPKESSWF